MDQTQMFVKVKEQSVCSCSNENMINLKTMNCTLNQTNTFTFRLRALHCLRFHITTNHDERTPRLGR